jgi:hypothetical protein
MTLTWGATFIDVNRGKICVASGDGMFHRV